MLLPIHADEIACARRNGQRPELVVFIDVGAPPGLRAAYPLNFVTVCGQRIALARFDFSWTIGLDVEIVADRVTGNERAIQAIEHVNAAAPRNLVVWETRTGRRWWIRDALGPWATPSRIEADRRFISSHVASTA
jgi:hypothetical protein